MAHNALLELAGLPDATRVTLRAGQVLYYRDHLPPGIFVLERGELDSDASGEGGHRLPALPAGATARVLPHPADLGRRSPVTITAATDTTALFVPRSTIVAQDRIQRLLEQVAGPATLHSPRIDS